MTKITVPPLCECGCGLPVRPRRTLGGWARFVRGHHRKGRAKARRDLTGQRFGQLIALSYSSDGKWNVLCDCGRETTTDGGHLTTGHTKSCGCTARARAASGRRRHGMTDTPTYKVWCNMRDRCERQEATAYANYGGRGITVCEAWRSFAAFLSDMGQRPSLAHSIDRIDNDGNYEPGNCRWATDLDQANNKRSNRFITHAGETMTLHAWSVRTGLSATLIHKRMKDLGWSVERALTTKADPTAGRFSATHRGR
jgi:hypothetical protein